MAFTRTALLVLGTAIAVVWLPSLLKPKLPVNVGGFALPKWKKVETVFRHLIESGTLRGGSFAVYHEGRPVVHLYGGYADEEAREPWAKDTISIFYSTTKGIGAICIALLVDRGFIDYDQPVIKYWPEFGQNGKEKVTVRQLLSHQAGLSAFDEPVSMFDIKDDISKVEAIAARSKPAWKLGDGFGYHALTIGVYMNALVRRVDPKHRSISQFLKEEITTPLGADFSIGCPSSEHYRMARYYDLSLWQTLKGLVENPELLGIFGPLLMGNEDSMLIKALHTFKEMKHDNFKVNNRFNREVQLAASTGVGSATGVAKIWGTVANDGKVDGKVSMKQKTIKTLYEPVISGIDKVMGLNMTMGVATHLRISPEGTMQAGHPGAGGQMGYMDHQRKLGWGYVSNFQDIKMTTDPYISLTNAMYDCIKR